MNATRAVWLLAAEAASWREPLSAALVEQGLHVERVPSATVDAWCSEGSLPALRALPQLLVLPMSTAKADDWRLLKLLDRPGVWRCLPRVVVGEAEDRPSVGTCHALGAANVVEIPDGDAQRAADRFARYWARTALLPAAEYLLG